jgi:hypothetical protein
LVVIFVASLPGQQLQQPLHLKAPPVYPPFLLLIWQRLFSPFIFLSFSDF